MRLLVIEDYAPLRQSLVQGLSEAGFAVDATGDGEEGLWYAGDGAYDAIILDLMLPKLDGMTLLRRMREAGGNCPVLILTARGELDDRVAGLDAGADDYLVKPFAFRELLARVNALVRRKFDARRPAVTVGDVTIEPQARRVTLGGEPVRLTAREFGVLEVLALRLGEAVTRTEIAEHLYGFDDEPNSNAIDVHVAQLRRKLEAGGRPRLIHTLRGVGYVLNRSEP